MLHRAPRRLLKSLRRNAGAFVVDNAFRGMSLLGRIHPHARPSRHGLEVARDVAYVDDGLVEHRLDVYRPSRGQGPWPVVLYVHGGGFRILSKDTHWLMGLAFARRGMVVFNINYRLAPRHRYPAAVEDACLAYEWVVRHAAEYGGDPSRLVLAGESAGANLVTSLAIAASWRRPEPFARRVFDTGVSPVAVLPACGLLQVTDGRRFSRRRKLPAFIADRIEEVGDAYLGRNPPAGPGALDLADPVVVLERDDEPDRPLPPFFAAVGTKDPLLDDTRRLQAALARRGVRCEACYFPGEIHAFHAMIWRAAALDCWRRSFAFLDGCLATCATAGQAASAPGNYRFFAGRGTRSGWV